jgi:hypothetical protein
MRLDSIKMHGATVKKETADKCLEKNTEVRKIVKFESWVAECV